MRDYKKISKMTIRDFQYDVDKIYPGLCTEFLSDMAQEMEGIMVDAVNNDIPGIHEHLVIINNTVNEMMKRQLEQTKTISKEKSASDQKKITPIYKKSLV